MLYSELCEVYEKLSKNNGRLQKIDILSDFYRKTGDEDIYFMVLLSMGVVYPGEEDLGIAKGLLRKTVISCTGSNEKELSEIMKKTGDLGISIETLFSKKSQMNFSKNKLTVEKVFKNLRNLSSILGKGSQERKKNIVLELLACASPVESKYIIRTILGTIRIGVGYGVVRDSISKSLNSDKIDSEKVEMMFNMTGDFGKVFQMLRKGETDIGVKIFTPIRVMLADREKDLESGISKFDNVCVEWKYDGFRIQIHKSNNKVIIFSRNLENVTKQFPDIESECKKIKLKNYIIEGEVVAVNKKGLPLPFQMISKRIQRKHKINEIMKEVPVHVNLFDLIYANNKNYMDIPLSNRWSKLKKYVGSKSIIKLVEHIETNNILKINKFYEKSLAMGQEGIMIKNLEAFYKPGKRVGFWIKYKPIMDPLDLAITGAEWGEGKRAGWLGSLVLSVRIGDEFTAVGKMASGLTENQLEDLTKRLKPFIISDNGKEVTLKPKIVVEVGYEEIQRSNKYKSGYAMRFPKLLRIRDDKNPSDASNY